jgi:rhomboid protease GluP
VVVALLNLGLGLMPGIDDWGHLGGLIAGTALTLFLGPRYEPAWVDTVQAQLVDRRPWSQVWPGMVFAAGLLGGLTLLALLSPVNR